MNNFDLLEKSFLIGLACTPFVLILTAYLIVAFTKKKSTTPTNKRVSGYSIAIGVVLGIIIYLIVNQPFHI